MRISDWSSDVCSSDLADAAGLQLERAPIELGDVASDVVDAVAGVVSERNLSITTRLDPAPAEADERRIHQIVTNLVANAVRYSPPDASITIETGCRSEEHTSELQSLMRISYAVFCLKKNTQETSQK